jgi:DNA-binding transcriptional LysR family regulator
MLNLQRLLVLQELERRGTLAAVARALNYSPSAVSQRLAQLEREVGAPLTEPIGRGVRLTDAGRVLVHHTRVAVAALEQAESELATVLGRVAGRLRVASFQTALLSLLPATLEQLESDHPDLRVDVAQRDATEATSGLMTGAFDVMLGEEYPDELLSLSAGLHRIDLGTDELMLALPLTGPWSTATTLADLAEAPWALDPDSVPAGRWARAICRAAGFEPDVRFDGIDLLVHAQMVRDGTAVALEPALLGPEHLHGVRLVRLAGPPKRTLFTVTRAARAEHPAVQALRHALAQRFSNRAGSDLPVGRPLNNNSQ